MTPNFNNEKEGQNKFFEKISINPDSIDYSCNTDGTYYGTIFEFKLNIANYNSTLFQTIKYLSKMRIQGIPVPRNILLIDLNQSLIYLFYSEKFINEIETNYVGAASKNNKEFNTKIKPHIIKYSTTEGLQELLNIVNTHIYTKININLFCVTG